ncbi:MAG: DUF5916 domain-containing protein [Candidatus Cyclobacteriaceae bacterium M2_1C_046]
MSLNKWYFFIFLSFLPTLLYSNDKVPLKALHAVRIDDAPKIDGVLDDPSWENFDDATHFYEFEPNNGELSKFKTSVQVTYTDNALYIAARLYDPNPSQIKKELGIRDDDRKNTDLFGFSIDTYNNGQNAFTFLVTAAGVQIDHFIANERPDYNWDAVWESAVTIDEEGWIVEMEIPFYAIRFPQKNVQDWGLNFYRKVQRKREESFWNYVDNSVRGMVNQYGVLHGIKDVEPPLRLSFLPYLTSVYEHSSFTGEGNFSLSGGMDVKYGINESFTLDLSLIPDFSQVRSDDQVLNLSPFEVRFDENRPFFTENTDIFNRGGLFYSRRVGQSRGSSFFRNPGDTIKSTPGNAPLINALKISGRNKNGTGIGIFNGITNRSYAEIAVPDTTLGYEIDPETGRKKYVAYNLEERIYDPLTNFNVLVVDQNLKNNSSIGVINTNVIRTDGGRDANVTGMDFNLLDRTNTYRLNGRGAASMIFDEKKPGPDIGYTYNIGISKVSGNWQYGISRNVESDNYNINDLGFIRAANEVSHGAAISYNIFKPFSIFNGLRQRIGANYQQLYEPRNFTEMNLSYRGDLNFRNFWNLGYNLTFKPKGEHDYFESRNRRAFIQPWAWNYNSWLSSDSRKPLFFRLSAGRWFRPDWEQDDYWISGSTRLRVNNQLSFNYNFRHNESHSDIGYVYVSPTLRTLNTIDPNITVFGGRDVVTTENNIGFNYTFNNRMGLNLRLRHFWSKVDYLKFYELLHDGNIAEIPYNGIEADAQDPSHNINFNAFNIDFNYSWQVAPGSFFTVAWRNASIFQTANTQLDFYENFSDVVNQPHTNSLSFRLTYFIDYMTLRNSI